MFANQLEINKRGSREGGGEGGGGGWKERGTSAAFVAKQIQAPLSHSLSAFVFLLSAAFLHMWVVYTELLTEPGK